MKRALKIIGIVVLVLFVSVIGAGIYFVHHFGKPFDAARHFLLHDVDYRAVSVACLDLMTQPQYRPLLDEYPSGDDPRLPAAIRDVKAFWLTASTNEVMIMKTGGFYHMGLVFHRSPTVTNATSWCSEKRDRMFQTSCSILYRSQMMCLSQRWSQRRLPLQSRPANEI
jgi:hypothetical protein